MGTEMNGAIYRLECGCEVELVSNLSGSLKSGRMHLPCSTHFGREKVRAPGVDYSDEYQYRIGIEIDDDNGAYKYFYTLSSAEHYWDERPEQHNEFVFQRKVKNTDKWTDLK